MPKTENMVRGYKAAMHNPNVSDDGREHARNELNRLQSHDEDEGETHDEGEGETDRHEANVKRGLKAATHNPNVTDVGKQQARGRLESMGEHPDQPGD